MNTQHRQPPLISIGQGDFRRDYHPEDLGMKPALPDSLNLRFLIREPADVYNARRAEHLTSHSLSEFRRCPLLYRKREMGLVPERDTTAYLIGRAAHTLILEGRERFSREYAVGGPINPKTGQPFGSQTEAFAEWAAQQSKPVLSDTHAALVEQMAAAVAEHPVARDMLRGGVAEGVVCCRYREHACQARIDWIAHDPQIGIVDLKTADELDGFEFALRALGCVHQLAFYRTLVSVASLSRATFGEISNFETRSAIGNPTTKLGDRRVMEGESAGFGSGAESNARLWRWHGGLRVQRCAQNVGSPTLSASAEPNA